MKVRVTAILVSLLVFLTSFFAVAQVQGGVAVAVASAQDLYPVRTQDGVDLVLQRYRPDAQSRHNVGAQPVILMPGLLCNHNFFQVETPAGNDYNLTLPEDLAGWAEGDPYIQADPMRYYSLAYYLWDQGYDVWLANYRGEGREPMRSGGAVGYAIDELGIYDMPAIVTKVREVTGKKPVWVGHSMGSTMAYIYLQGARFIDPTMPTSGVVSDDYLRAMRNDGNGPQALKALVDLDGPVIPGGSIPGLLQPLLWTALYVPFYLDLRALTATLGWVAASPAMMLESLARMLWGALGYPDLGLLNLLLLINPDNMSGEVASYFFQFGLDGVSTRVLAQFCDAIVHQKFREHYRNRGFLSWLRWAPPAPCPGDGFYYYSDNLGKISLPSLVIADATRDITNPEDIRRFYDSKARNDRDKFAVIPGTAHVDLVIGLNAPEELFPLIGEWLESLD
ncbi:alpha/beta hydrolase [Candidatus Solincola sp.]|nr:alpha/beta fold hydrolase [Actinomycetota bacterium]MDI7252608.1 alpha/beta fold hydrolase [Actinomycetota bacterium]